MEKETNYLFYFKNLKNIFNTPWKVWDLIKSFINEPFYRIYFLLNGVSYGKRWRLYGKPIIHKHKGSKIIIGNDLVLRNNFSSNPLGINHATILTTWLKGAFIKIGNDVGISGASICASKGITIGNNVLIGANVLIIDSDFHPIKDSNRRYSQKKINCKEIVIEDNVFIGVNAIILKGVTIGKNSVIGAGSVVFGNIPQDCIAFGNPAKIIKNINNKK